MSAYLTIGWFFKFWCHKNTRVSNSSTVTVTFFVPNFLVRCLFYCEFPTFSFSPEPLLIFVRNPLCISVLQRAVINFTSIYPLYDYLGLLLLFGTQEKLTK